MAGQKRPKLDDSDSSPSESAASMASEDIGEKTDHLKDISAKLSTIIDLLRGLTVAVQDNKNISPENTTNIMTEISRTITGLDTNIPPQAEPVVRNELETEDFISGEAMRIKSIISNVWERKIQARRDAYWAKVRYQGFADVHERWIEQTPIVIPKRLQQFEINNEREDQKMLRERSVIQNFRTEIEMDKLRVESCVERIRKLDAEMEEIILTKCSGRVANYLIDLYKRNVKRGEEVSHKRWEKTQKWLLSYEENFKRDYGNSSPFFKPRTTRREQGIRSMSYADAVKSNYNPSTGYQRNQRQNGSNQNFQQLLQQLMVHLNGSQNRRPGDRNGNDYREPRNRNWNDYRRPGNRSNNYPTESEIDLQPITPSDREHSFLEIDHNWDSFMER